MQIKNIISFIFLSQSVISFPRRNRNRNRGGTGVEDSVSSSTVSSSTVSSSTVSSFSTNLCTC